LNNTVGKFESSPSVEARMRSFEDSNEKMLWPEKRDRDSVLGDKVPGMVDRTTSQSFLRVSRGYIPPPLDPLLGLGERFLPAAFRGGGIDIGPIPTGTPVNLLASLNVLSEDPDPAKRAEYEGKALKRVGRMLADLKKLPPNATDEQAKQVLGNLVNPMLELSKCPDMIVNRGHYFGTGYLEPAEQADPALRAQAITDRGPRLSDSDKQALIEFLKTF